MDYNRVMNNSGKINPCKPGFGASCSFCCGSHNFMLPPEEIENILAERNINAGLRKNLNQKDFSFKKICDDTLQCPHMGMVEPGIIGCLAYNDADFNSEFQEFFNSVCKEYYCAACKELTDRQILFAAELMHDWYYYSLLIYNIDILLDLYAEHQIPGDVPDDILESVKAELEQKLLDEDMI
ncbi:MAG: hypothetical protein JW982_13640 [Spirochaetes bacterium]|nr:hypothetical protein [Spirochaetota bacterium]